MHGLPCAVALVFLVTRPALADEDGPVAPGTRIRLRLQGGVSVAGPLAAARDDAVFLTTGERVPRQRIKAVAVSAGRRSRFRGALKGAAIGVLVGVPAAAFSAGPRIFGPLALWGGAIGAVLPRPEIWKHVELDQLRTDRAAPGVAPTSR